MRLVIGGSLGHINNNTSIKMPIYKPVSQFQDDDFFDDVDDEDEFFEDDDFELMNDLGQSDFIARGDSSTIGGGHNATLRGLAQRVRASSDYIFSHGKSSGGSLENHEMRKRGRSPTSDEERGESVSEGS